MNQPKSLLATAVFGLVIAVAVSVVAAAVTSVVPIWRAVSRPPIKSLSSS